MKIHHLAIQTLVLTSRGSETCHSRRTQLQNMNNETVINEMINKLCSESFAPYTKQWRLGACRLWDIWWWDVVCKFYNIPWDICQNLWPSSTTSCQSTHSIQVSNTRRMTQKTLWYQNEQSIRTEMHLWKSDWNHFSNHSPCGLDPIGKNRILCFVLFFAVQTLWNQSG